MQDGSDNLNSLIDIMSCVAGILVIVLAVSLVEVGSIGAIEVDTVAAAQRELRRVEERREELRRRWRQMETALPGDGRREVERLRARAEETWSELEDTAAAEGIDEGLGERIRSGRERVEELEREVAAAQEELEGARAARDAEPATSPPQPSTVRLPDPRPAPPNSEPVHFLCRHGRVVPLGNLLDRLDAAVHDALGREGPIPLALLADRMTRVKRHFDRNVVGNHDLRWRMEIDGGLLFAVLEWRREEAGETPEQLAAAGSHLRRLVSALDPRSQYVQFLVWGDSFEGYLLARGITDDAGIGAGWIAYDPAEEVRLNLFGEASGASKPLD